MNDVSASITQKESTPREANSRLTLSKRTEPVGGTLFASIIIIGGSLIIANGIGLRDQRHWPTREAS